ncbi:MAG: hypothetical protein EBZ48_00675 [Proteobacteria bacterium]|nr:hypothetical protein [Pseudomonadota bacterium]
MQRKLRNTNLVHNPLIVSSCIYLVCCLCLVSTVDAQQYPGHYQSAEFPQVMMTSLSDAVQRDASWSPPEQALPASAHPSGEQRLLWASSKMQLTLSMSNPIVQFTRAAQSETPEQSFEIEVGRPSTTFVLRSSAPSQPAFAAGIIAPASATASFVKYIPGANGTGFIAIIPKTPPGDWFAIGLCPCTRTVDNGTYRFTPSLFVPVAVHFTPKAEVLVYQETGEAIGKAFVSIRTTPNIPPPLTYERALEQPSPKLTNVYVPDESKQPVAAMNIAGVAVRGELTAPTQSSWKREIEGVVQVHPLELSAPLEFKQDGAMSRFEGKGCYAVIRGIISTEEF